MLLSWDARLGIKEYKVQIAKTPDFGGTVEETTTDNTSYAPMMTQYGYAQGGTLYWRVAGVDEDRNQGDWSQVKQILLQPRMRLSVLGKAKHKKKTRVTVRVSTTSGSWLGGVLVRVTGPGMKPVSKRTNAVGNVELQGQAEAQGQAALQRLEGGFPAGLRHPTSQVDRRGERSALGSPAAGSPYAPHVVTAR